MRWITALVLALAITVGLWFNPYTVGATERRSAEARQRSCRYNGVLHVNWARWEVRRTIACAVEHWPVSLAMALYVANRESGFRHDAYNAYSAASGIYQHLARYWPYRVHVHNRGPAELLDVAPGVFNARSNILVAVKMAHRGGWGPWGM